MTLSKNFQENNNFVLGTGKKSTIHPMKYTRPAIRMVVITPNQLFANGLKVEFAAGDVVNIIHNNTSAFTSLQYWEQQPRSVFPEVLLLDTQQRKLSCHEVMLRFKYLHQKTKIIVAGDHFRNENIKDYFDVGADAYVDQAASGLTFLKAIETVVCHEKQFLYTPQLPFHGHIVIEPYE
jgi:DNA-binding NarL/FixJ family response regulator